MLSLCCGTGLELCYTAQISINADVCTGSLEGQVRYEPNRNLLYYCDGSEWRVSHIVLH